MASFEFSIAPTIVRGRAYDLNIKSSKQSTKQTTKFFAIIEQTSSGKAMAQEELVHPIRDGSVVFSGAALQKGQVRLLLQQGDEEERTISMKGNT